MVMSDGSGTRIVPDSDVLKRREPTESTDNNTSVEQKHETFIPRKDTDVSYISNKIKLSSWINKTSELYSLIGDIRDKILGLRVQHASFYLIKYPGSHNARVDKKWIEESISQVLTSIDVLNHCISEYKRIASELTDELNKANNFDSDKDIPDHDATEKQSHTFKE
jgi:hypothetical protein